MYMDSACLCIGTWFTVAPCVIVKANETTRAFADTAPTVEVIVKVGWAICLQYYHI